MFANSASQVQKKARERESNGTPMEEDINAENLGSNLDALTNETTVINVDSPQA